jgi:hypothetical protein
MTYWEVVNSHESVSLLRHFATHIHIQTKYSHHFQQMCMFWFCLLCVSVNTVLN